LDIYILSTYTYIEANITRLVVRASSSRYYRRDGRVGTAMRRTEQQHLGLIDSDCADDKERRKLKTLLEYVETGYDFRRQKNRSG
jgi:hypothetical protein